MAKEFAVVFSENGARIVKGPEVDRYRDSHNAVINPDLSSVMGVPPHRWALVDGEIVVRPEGIKVRVRKGKRHLDKFLRYATIFLFGVIFRSLLG